jgi:hypothetical protein
LIVAAEFGDDAGLVGVVALATAGHSLV